LIAEGSPIRLRFWRDEQTMTISEHEKAKAQCPTCKGTKIVAQFSSFVAQTRKKRLRDVFACADL
jgi:hypothetical protein